MQRENGKKGSVKYLRAGSTAQNEIQTLTLPDGSDSGAFRVKYGTEFTTPLDHEISTANMQTALRLLTGLAAVVVTGTPGVQYTVTQTNAALTLLKVVNDTVMDGAVWEGGVVVHRTQGGGTGAAVNIPIKGFDFTQGVPAADASTNATGGFDDVTPGNKKGSGTVTCLWDSDLEGEVCPTEVEAGDEVTLELYPSDKGGYWSVPALITEVPLKVTENTTTAWTFNFTNKGAFAWVPAV